MLVNCVNYPLTYPLVNQLSYKYDSYRLSIFHNNFDSDDLIGIIPL
jgi:hypothetical protein